MSHQATLTIQLFNFWHSGSGHSAGQRADNVCIRKDGLPLLTGRHLKGLLRQGFYLAEQWGFYTDLTLPKGPAPNLTSLLFGSDPDKISLGHSIPGLLVIDDAKLPLETRNYLMHSAHHALRDHLFDWLSSTAITEKGAASPKALRMTEVTRALNLHANLSVALACDKAGELRKQQQEWLKQEGSPWSQLIQSLSLVDAVGGHKSRGLGEALMTLTAKEIAA